MPLLVDTGNPGKSVKLNWANLSKEDIDRYTGLTDSLLNHVVLPRDAIMCLNMNCADTQHAADFCDLYDNVTKVLNACARSFCSHKKVVNIKPGWKEYVSEHHAAAREAFKLLD